MGKKETDNRQQTTDNRQQTTDKTDNRQKSGDCLVPSFGFQISTFGGSLAVVWELRKNTEYRIIYPKIT